MVSLHKDPHGESVLRPETTLNSVNKPNGLGLSNNNNPRLSLSEDSADSVRQLKKRIKELESQLKPPQEEEEEEEMEKF